MATETIADDGGTDYDIDFVLGEGVRDEVSGFTGVVTEIARHLTGCTRIGVWPAAEDEDARTVQRGDREFFYEAQLESTGVITFPDDSSEAITSVDVELGETVVDTVTGFEGVAAVITYQLWNCPQVAVQPTDGSDKTEKGDLEWFDAPRLEVLDDGVREDFAETSQQMTAETGAIADARSRPTSPQ